MCSNHSILLLLLLALTCLHPFASGESFWINRKNYPKRHIPIPQNTLDLEEEDTKFSRSAPGCPEATNSRPWLYFLGEGDDGRAVVVCVLEWSQGPCKDGTRFRRQPGFKHFGTCQEGEGLNDGGGGGGAKKRYKRLETDSKHMGSIKNKTKCRDGEHLDGREKCGKTIKLRRRVG